MSAQTKSPAKKSGKILGIILFILFITIFNFYNVINAETTKPKGHLLYDPIDDLWLCVGSPTNCAF